MPQERGFDGKIFTLESVGTPDSIKRHAELIRREGHYFTRVRIRGENTAELWLRHKRNRRIKEFTRKDSWNTTMTQQMMRRSSARRTRERTLRRDTLTRKPRIKGMTRSGLGTLGTME